MNEIIYIPDAKTAIAQSIETSLKLVLIKDLINSFHECEIRYCHWKSNEHLDASMIANTDLDVLFDAKQKEKLEVILKMHGFIKFASVKEKQYKDIEDFIGLDLPSGKIVHLHAHWRLTMGEPYLKGYQLDMEDEILSTRVFNEKFGIYCADPAFELILLYFRVALKLRYRDIVNIYLKGRLAYSGKVLKEYKWLRQRCTDKDIEDILQKIVHNYSPIYHKLTGDFNRKEILKLSFLIKKEFRKNRMFSPVMALVVRWYREVAITILRKSSRLLSQPIVTQRINPRGGLIVALIGADGSGKSTVIENLKATFEKKLDVYIVYLGKGRANKVSWARRILIKIKKTVGEAPSALQKQSGVAEPATFVKKRGFKITLYKCMEALMVAYEKRKNLKRMLAAKRKGMLVICDRFPQRQIMGYNDGPMLDDLSNSPNPLFRTLSNYEARIYKFAEKNPPDLLFKLVADARLIEARKPSKASLEMLEAKIEGIKKLEFPSECRVITVDAAQTLDKVLFEVKREIWNSCL